MQLLPFARATLRSDASPEAVSEHLRTLVADGWFFIDAPKLPFHGKLNGPRFKIMRVRRTSLGMMDRMRWQPVLEGAIAPAPAGSEVRVRLRPRSYHVWNFAMSLAIGLAVLAFLWRWAEHAGHAMSTNGAAVRFAQGATGVFAVSAVFNFIHMRTTFWPEVRRSVALLCEALGAREAP